MDIVSFGLVIVFIVVLLSCLGGAIFLFYRAIRSFRAKKLWSGFWSLLCAILLSLVVLGMSQLGGHPLEKGRRATCHSHLMLSTLFLKFYARDHGGKYPTTFDDLVGGYAKAGNQSVFVCPSSGHRAGALTNIHEWTDYAYVTGLTEEDPPACVVMFCLPDHHQGDGADVAFLDGHIQWSSSHLLTNGLSGYDEHTFQELTNNPALFYGTTNAEQLADLKKRTRIIYPHAGGR